MRALTGEIRRRKGARATGSGAKKKEEFTGLMVYMVPGNSFPQICVVSGMIISNVPEWHKSTKVLHF